MQYECAARSSAMQHGVARELGAVRLMWQHGCCCRVCKQRWYCRAHASWQHIGKHGRTLVCLAVTLRGVVHPERGARAAAIDSRVHIHSTSSCQSVRCCGQGGRQLSNEGGNPGQLPDHWCMRWMWHCKRRGGPSIPQRAWHHTRQTQASCCLLHCVCTLSSQVAAGRTLERLSRFVGVVAIRSPQP